MSRNNASRLISGVAPLMLLALAVAGCGGSSSGKNSPPKTADGRSATLGVSNGSLGDLLVDSRGRTLYLFERDAGTSSVCTGACAVNWPPLRSEVKPTSGSGANSSLLGTTGRSDGKPQVTYNGHPLYLFSGDQQPGDTDGQGINAFGGLWYVVSASGNAITTPVDSDGYGY